MMNNVDIFDRISTLYNSFTKSEKRLADYILKERDQIMFMSITELAEKSKVGESGIFRFCKNLGLKGYQEFKISVAQSLNSEENDTTRNIDTEILLNDSLDVLAGKVKQTNISALDQTYNLLDYKDLDLAVEKIIAAERIRFFGIGSPHHRHGRAEQVSACDQQGGGHHRQSLSGHDGSPDERARSGHHHFLLRPDQGLH
jgi:DNA-binding MurR/RpiR family transcriptional regulator